MVNRDTRTQGTKRFIWELRKRRLLVYSRATLGKFHCVGPHSLFPVQSAQDEKRNQHLILFTYKI